MSNFRKFPIYFFRVLWIPKSKNYMKKISMFHDRTGKNQPSQWYKATELQNSAVQNLQPPCLSYIQLPWFQEGMTRAWMRGKGDAP